MNSDPQADDDEFRLAPQEGPTREELERQSNPPPKLPLSDEERQWLAGRHKPRWRFTIGELLFVTTFLAIGLAGVSWLPPGVFAGCGGFVALAVLISLMFYKDASRGFYLVVYSLMLMYLAAVVMSVVRWKG